MERRVAAVLTNGVRCFYSLKNTLKNGDLLNYLQENAYFCIACVNYEE